MIPQISFRTRDLLSNIVGNLFDETKATLKEGAIAAEKVFYGVIDYLAEPSKIKEEMYSVFEKLETYIKINGMG